MTRAAYIRQEAIVSALVSAAISAGFVFAVFGVGPVPVWGLPGYVSDFVPQGFMVGLMAALVPTLLARRAVVRGAIEGVATTEKRSSALALAQHPREFAKLRANPKLALKAFKESLRWDSTVQTFFRTTTRDVSLANVTIPEGSKVLLFLAAANRDQARWDNPDSFELSRNASGHVGFGFGIHQCLGQMVARLEGELIATALAERVKSIWLAGEPVRRLNNTLHAIESLPVEVEPA